MHEPPTSEQRFMATYWPATPVLLRAIKDHAHACRLRADAGDAPWGRLAAFTAGLTRRSLPAFEENETDEYSGHDVRLTARQRPGTRATLADLLHDLIMEDA